MRSSVGFVERADLERARDLARDAEELTRRLYKTARWRRLRLSVLSRDLYTCRLCGRIEGNSALLVCDHLEPHRGDVELDGGRICAAIAIVALALAIGWYSVSRLMG